MDESLSALRAVVVSGSSPAGAVSASIGDGRGILVKLMADALGEHNEVSLAQEIEEAVIATWETYLAEIGAIVREEMADEHRARQARSPRQLIDREARAWAMVANIASTGAAPKGYVEATVYGDGDLVIELRNGLFSSPDLTIEALETEINEAIRSAGSMFARDTADAFQSAAAWKGA